MIIGTFQKNIDRNVGDPMPDRSWAILAGRGTDSHGTWLRGISCQNLDLDLILGLDLDTGCNELL